MIKYLDLPGFKALGECGMMSHLYQWMETDNPDDLKRLMIFVSAFVTEPTYWVGRIHNEHGRRIINCPNAKVDITKLQDFFDGELRQIKSLREFMKVNDLEEMFLLLLDFSEEDDLT